MAEILRGDIYWAELNPIYRNATKGKCAVLVISNNFFNEKSGTVIALALTSNPPKAGFPLTYELITEQLPKLSWIKISQIRTLPIESLSGKLGTVSEDTLNIIIEGLNEIID